MKATHPYLVEFNRFMDWFKSTYPDLYENYKKNFDLPLKRGGKITVNNHYQISEENRQRLIEIAKNYYHRADGT